MPMLTADDRGQHATRVGLCYLRAAIEYLEDSQEFALPKSRRLSTQWTNKLHRVARSAATDGLRRDAEGGLSTMPVVPDVVSVATDLLLSAFRQSCSNVRGRRGHADEVLDGVIVLVLKRAHETCTLVELAARQSRSMTSSALRLDPLPKVVPPAPVASNTATRSNGRG